MRKTMLATVREEYAFRIIDAAREPMAKRPVKPRPALALFLTLACAALTISWIVVLRARSGLADVRSATRG
jgi:hypothetical protein